MLRRQIGRTIVFALQPIADRAPRRIERVSALPVVLVPGAARARTEEHAHRCGIAGIEAPASLRRFDYPGPGGGEQRVGEIAAPRADARQQAGTAKAGASQKCEHAYSCQARAQGFAEQAAERTERREILVHPSTRGIQHQHDRKASLAGTREQSCHGSSFGAPDGAALLRGVVSGERYLLSIDLALRHHEGAMSFQAHWRIEQRTQARFRGCGTERCALHLKLFQARHQRRMISS